jgi:hypothetical protein
MGTSNVFRTYAIYIFSSKLKAKDIKGYKLSHGDHYYFLLWIDSEVS